MVVETHMHAVAQDQEKYPRHLAPHTGLRSWVRDCTAEDLLQFMNEAGVDRAVLVQGYGAYGGDNSYLADSVARYPDRFAGVFALDFMQSDAPERIAYWAGERGLHGARIVTLTQPELMLDDPRIIPAIERVAALRTPLCVLTQFHQLPLMAPLLERFPSVTFALDHMGIPKLSGGSPYAGVQPLFDLARFPNCYLKFSTVSIDAAMAGRSTPADFFRRLLDCFGARRVIWGSNFPATYDRSLKQQVELAREQLGFLPVEEQRRIFGETALSLWPMLR